MRSSSFAASQWSDLPRRLITVSIGAPFIVFLLSTNTTSVVFFQCVHLLCTIEWLQLIPSSPTDSFTIDGRESISAREIPAPLPYYVVSMIYPVLALFITISKEFNQVLVYIIFSTAVINLVFFFDLVRFETKAFDRSRMDKAKVSPKNSESSFLQEKSRTHPTCIKKRKEEVLQCLNNRKNHSIHGLIYVSIPFYYWMRISSVSFAHTTYLLFVIWNTDTGALLAGRFSKMLTKRNPTTSTSTMNADIVGNIISKISLGRFFIRIIKSISPSKSITGFVGGIVFGTLTAIYLPAIMLGIHDSWIGEVMSLMRSAILNLLGCLIGHLDDPSSVDVEEIRNSGLLDFDSMFSSGGASDGVMKHIMFPRMILGVCISFTSIIGDLVESSVKRNAGKKDSGKLLPGHGGILDRFDSTFLSVVLYSYLILENK